MSPSAFDDFLDRGEGGAIDRCLDPIGASACGLPGQPHASDLGNGPEIDGDPLRVAPFRRPPRAPVSVDRVAGRVRPGAFHVDPAQLVQREEAPHDDEEQAPHCLPRPGLSRLAGGCDPTCIPSLSLSREEPTRGGALRHARIGEWWSGIGGQCLGSSLRARTARLPGVGRIRKAEAARGEAPGVDFERMHRRAPSLHQVTSSSTEATTGERSSRLWRLSSLQEVLIVSHREGRLTLHRREGDTWQTLTAVPAEEVTLASVSVSVAVDDVYRDVFEEAT